MYSYNNPGLQSAIKLGILLQKTGVNLNHLYGYALQNPLSYFDPFGLSPDSSGGNDDSNDKLCSDKKKDKKKDECGALTKIAKALGKRGQAIIPVCRLMSRGVEHGEESRGSPKPPSMPPKDRTPPISAPKDPKGDKE